MEHRSAINIPILNRFLDRVGTRAPDLIDYPGDLKSIYHYTDLSGLLGIIENHDLWLTNSRYSNDDEELTHGYRVAVDLIDQQLGVQGTRSRKQFLRIVREMLSEPTPEGVYICCFCQAGDLLSQWRGYAANGAGVCIGFDPQGFSYVTGSDSPPRGLIRLWTVFYKVEDQKEIVNEALDFAFSDLADMALKERARHAAEAISFFIPTFKNKDFEGEQEIRLIFTPNPDFVSQPRFRISQSRLVPFYSLKELAGDLSSPRALPMTEVVIGPSMNKLINAESARLLLDKAHYQTVSVQVSKTPYRG